MAYADLNTGKIHGCEKGSRTYYHEQAHLKYEATNYGRRVRIVQDVSLDILLPLVALQCIYPNIYLISLILVTLVTKICSNLAEEIDCWLYALNKYRGDSRVRRIKRKV